MSKKFLSRILVLCLLLNVFGGIGYAVASDGELSVKEQLDKNLSFLLEMVDNPALGTGAGEWSILCLARGNYPVPEGYYEKYHNNVVREVKEKDGKLHRVKYTEHSRLILGLTSIGKDVTDVGGYNQLEKLADFNTLIVQGINGPIFALIALDTHNYEIPIVDGVEVQTTREMLVDYILNREIDGGGWDLSSTHTTPDPDITAMAIQGLTPYYGEPKVKAAVDRGLEWLSNAQLEDGGYSSWGSVNSESIAQVVVALTGLGISPHTDPRFIKNGNSAIDALLTFTVPEGGFMHVKAGGNTGGGAAAGIVDGMATDQGTYALIAYDRFINNKNPLYDMTDVQLETIKTQVPTPEEPKKEPEEEPSENPKGDENLIEIDLTKLYIDANNISNWAYKAIEDASQNGFIQGSDSKFNPKDNITRAEFTKIITSILDLDINTESVINFIDVKETDWYYNFVNAAYKAGIITGSDNKFNPNEKITREQMAAIIVRAFDVKPGETDVEIKDINKVSAWAKEDVESAVAHGLIVGDNNIFDPHSYATREMAAVVLMRGYAY